MQQRWVVHNGSDLGAAIAEIRAGRALTQQQLATQIGTSRTWLAKLERGRSTKMVDLLVRILRSLGASVVVEFDDRPPTHTSAPMRADPGDGDGGG